MVRTSSSTRRPSTWRPFRTVNGIVVTSRPGWPNGCASCRTRSARYPARSTASLSCVACGPSPCGRSGTPRTPRQSPVPGRSGQRRLVATRACAPGRTPIPRRPSAASPDAQRGRDGLVRPGGGWRPTAGVPGSGRSRSARRPGLFTLAESLGGVESLIELPAVMTHASVAGSPLEVRSGADPPVVRHRGRGGPDLRPERRPRPRLRAAEAQGWLVTRRRGHQARERAVVRRRRAEELDGPAIEADEIANVDRRHPTTRRGSPRLKIAGPIGRVTWESTRVAGAPKVASWTPGLHGQRPRRGLCRRWSGRRSRSVSWSRCRAKSPGKKSGLKPLLNELDQEGPGLGQVAGQARQLALAAGPPGRRRRSACQACRDLD